jgi:hypothetical protein
MILSTEGMDGAIAIGRWVIGMGDEVDGGTTPDRCAVGLDAYTDSPPVGRLAARCGGRAADV